MPRNRLAIPTVTQAAQMEPPGPDRDALMARADELFEARGGVARLHAIGVLEKTIAQYEADLDARAKDPKAPIVVGVREGLRATLAIDRAYAALEWLMEQCVEQAREEFYRRTNRRIAEQVWTFENDTPAVVRGGNAATELRRAIEDESARIHAQIAARRAAEKAQPQKPEPTTVTKSDRINAELAKSLLDKQFQASIIQAPGAGNGKPVTKP